jgi:hypothetical protein
MDAAQNQAGVKKAGSRMYRSLVERLQDLLEVGQLVCMGTGLLIMVGLGGGYSSRS